MSNGIFLTANDVDYLVKTFKVALTTIEKQYDPSTEEMPEITKYGLIKEAIKHSINILKGEK